MEKLTAKEQNAIREQMYANLTECLKVMGCQVVEITEGLLVQSSKCDIVVKAIIKKDRVDVDAELEEIAEKAREKAEKTAKAEAKKAKDEAKRAKAKAEKEKAGE